MFLFGLDVLGKVFSSPEPKASGELIVWAGSVVRPQFQRASPLNLLDQNQTS